MIAVYPLVNSPCDDLEILLSIASLRHVPWISGVAIVGDVPICMPEIEELCRALSVSLEHAQYTKQVRAPIQDVANKIHFWCQQNSAPFLMMCDDLVFTRDLPRSEFAHHYNGEIKTITGKYWRRVARNTDAVMQAQGWGRRNFDTHSPLIILPELYEDAWRFIAGRNVSMKSLYLNRPETVAYNDMIGIPSRPGGNAKMTIFDVLSPSYLDSVSRGWVSLHHATVTKAQIRSCLGSLAGTGLPWVNP